MANENYRMYNKKVEFLKPLQKGHKCTICKLLLRAPLQTDCGHRFCLQCFYINCGSEVCPEDNIDLTWKTVHSDKFCENEIKALEVYCQNRQRCGWTGTYESLQAHLSECPKCRLQCPKGCGVVVTRSEMESHFIHDCALAQITCPMVGWCNFQGSRAELCQHLLAKNVEHMAMNEERMNVMQLEVNSHHEKLINICSNLAAQGKTNEDLDKRFQKLEEQVAAVLERDKGMKTRADNN